MFDGLFPCSLCEIDVNGKQNIATLTSGAINL